MQAIISGVPQDQIQFVRSLLLEPLGTPIADGNRRAAEISVYLAVLLGGVRGFLSLATTNGHTAPWPGSQTRATLRKKPPQTSVARGLCLPVTGDYELRKQTCLAFMYVMLQPVVMKR